MNLFKKPLPTPDRGAKKGFKRKDKRKPSPSLAKRQKKKYRLKPAAKKLYIRLLVFLVAAVALVFAARMLFFRSTYSLGGYDMLLSPFSFATQLYDTIKIKSEADLVVTDVTIKTDKTANVTSIEMDLAQLLSENRYVEWKLNIVKDKAELKKGLKVNQSYAQLKERFPPLKKTLETLELVPFSYVLSQVDIEDGEYHEYTTKNYRPDLNADYKKNITDAITLLWVPRTGAVSSVDAKWNTIGNYMALDCAVYDKKGKAEPQYIILLEVRS